MISKVFLLIGASRSIVKPGWGGERYAVALQRRLADDGKRRQGKARVGKRRQGKARKGEGKASGGKGRQG